MDHPDPRGPQDQRESRGPLVCQELQDPQGLQDSRTVPQDHKDHQDPKVYQGLQDSQGPQDHQGQASFHSPICRCWR